MKFFAILLVAAALLVPIHIFAMALTGHLFGVSVREVSLGWGRPLYRKGRLVVRWCLPLGGYCRFKDTRAKGAAAEVKASQSDAYDKKPRLVQSVIPLAGPLALLVVAIVVSPISTPTTFVSAFEQILFGGLGPLTTAQAHIQSGAMLLAQSGFLALLGMFAAKLAALNLLPLPNLNGGQAIAALLPINGARQEKIIQWLIWPWVLLFGSWLVAAVYYVATG